MTYFTDALWGGVLKEFRFDVNTHECALGIDVEDGGVSQKFVLRCENVVEVRFFSRIPAPWTYADVTEIYATYDHSLTRWRLEILLWSEEAGITLSCSRIRLNDALQSPDLDLS